MMEVVEQVSDARSQVKAMQAERSRTGDARAWLVAAAA
jgi:hypothetical protein